MIKETSINSCCGSRVKLFVLEKPLKKHHLQIFKEKGYLAPAHFSENNVFYVQKNYLILTGIMGGKQFRISCNGQKCEESFKELKEILEKIL